MSLDWLLSAPAGPADSPFRRLDPRTRLVCLLALMLPLLAAQRLPVIGSLLAATLAIAGLAQLAPGRVWRGLRMLAPWLLLVAFIQLVFGLAAGASCSPRWQIGPLQITDCALELAALSGLRFIGLFLQLMLLMAAIPVPELARAVESLARPLRRVGLPGHEIALVGVIAVRFVPTMALELERLRKAQMARGANFGRGRWKFVKQVQRTLPLLVPLFLIALRRAERLADAMDARGFGSGVRGSYHVLRLRAADWLALGVLAAFLILIFIVW